MSYSRDSTEYRWSLVLIFSYFIFFRWLWGFITRCGVRRSVGEMSL